MYVRHDGVKSLLGRNGTPHGRVVPTSFRVISPRLQHSHWLWRMGSFDEECIIITGAGLAIKVHVAVQDAADVAQIGAAIAGGGAGREPENEEESIEHQLAPNEPRKQPGATGWTGGEDEVDQHDEGKN